MAKAMNRLGGAGDTRLSRGKHADDQNVTLATSRGSIAVGRGDLPTLGRSRRDVGCAPREAGYTLNPEKCSSLRAQNSFCNSICQDRTSGANLKNWALVFDPLLAARATSGDAAVHLGGASRPLPERKQEGPRLSATKLKRPRARWLRPRHRSGSLLRRRTRNRPTRDKPPASRFPTDRPSACWDCWLQGRP
jgi:hypothetical protein